MDRQTNEQTDGPTDNYINRPVSGQMETAYIEILSTLLESSPVFSTMFCSQLLPWSSTAYIFKRKTFLVATL